MTGCTQLSALAFPELRSLASETAEVEEESS